MWLGIDSVTKRYWCMRRADPSGEQEVVALEDVSLEVHEGEVLGVVGRAGSGKTTLINVLAGLERPDSGTVYRFGKSYPAQDYDKIPLDGKVAVLFQRPEDQVFELTVERDVGFGLRNLGCPEQEIRTRVRWALEAVGLDYDDVSGESPFCLSRGEMRRVGIAGILVLQPRVLILDEPTADLDPAGREEVMRYILEWKRSTDATLICVNHDLQWIMDNADRVVVLSKGRLIGVGAPVSLFADEVLLSQAGLLPPPSVQMAKRLLSHVSSSADPAVRELDLLDKTHLVPDTKGLVALVRELKEQGAIKFGTL